MGATATVLKSPFFSWNGTDLSAQVKEIRLPFSLDEIEKTASGDDTHVKIPGLANFTFEVAFYRNYGASSVESLINAGAIAGTVGATEMRKDTAIVGASNPKFTAQTWPKPDSLIGGAVGSGDEVRVTFVAAGSLTRATV